MVLLEVNLSCNFFPARFDKASYFRMVEEYFLDLESRAEDSEGARVRV